MRTRKNLVVAALVGATVLGGAGVAMAQVPGADGLGAGDLGQGGSAVTALLEELTAQFGDFSDGNSPEGADGTEVEPIGADPRSVEGPLGGLIKNGPFE